MTTSPRNSTVLVVTDSAGDAATVSRVLAEEFEKVEVSTRSDAAVADFERVLPDVVVLAFDTIEKSQEYCLGLLRFSKVAQRHPHGNVILCAREELHTVFAQCKKEHYDDYVLYWPQPHDGHRLVMAVWNSIRRLAAARDQVPDRASAAAHASSAYALGGVVDRQLEQGLSHVAAVRASLVSVEHEVAAAPAHEGVKRALAVSRASMAPIGAWAAAFRAEVAPHVADAKALAGKLQPGRPVVLVVEDDAFAAKLIGKALEKQAFDIEVAGEAKAMFEVLRRVLPAAILMDVNLPGTDGLALTEWLKASPTLAHIPVLMLTGDATREVIARSKAVGAADFIVKPFTRDALLAKLNRVLA